MSFDFTNYVATWLSSPLAQQRELPPWELTSQSEIVVRRMLQELPEGEYDVSGEIAVHHSAKVEQGAVLKGPLILGPRCFVASGAYIRGGNWVEADCTFGPGTELKSSFVFSGSKLAHFNFVGDSIVGRGANFEAGSIICNYRNERADKEILVRVGGQLRRSGVTKFGALVGDGCRVGANAVLAPGVLLQPAAVVPRAALLDQERNAERDGD